MENERFLAEITSIRKKYNQAVFDLEKSKENEKQISLKLDEALKKIELLTCEKVDSEQNSSVQANQEKNEKNLSAANKISLLQKQNSVLEARIKQMERGIHQNDGFQSRNEQECVEEKESEETGFDIEEILDHRKKGSTYSFLVRWKGYGPEGDTWEPKSNLQCKNCKIVNSYLKKNKI